MRRAEAAARTRSRILQAAAELFSANGYGQTTLQAIADQAGVSVESVGLAGPKRRLLFAAFAMAFAGNRHAFPLAGEPAYSDLIQRLPLPQAIDAYLDLLANSIARTHKLWRAMQSAADADPRAASMLDDVRAERRREYEKTARTLVALGLATPHSVPVIVQEFYVNASHEAYNLLHTECGLTVTQFRDRLRHHITHLIQDLSNDHPDTTPTPPGFTVGRRP